VKNNCHRYACFLKQQSSIIVYRFIGARRKNFFVLFSVFCVYIYIYNIYISKYSYTYCIYKYINTYLHIYIHIYIHTKYIHIYIYAAVSNRKRKPRQFSLFRLPFAHRPQKLIVGPFVDKETNGSYPSANGRTKQSTVYGLNGLSHL
jgi:hypothetical protein